MTRFSSEIVRDAQTGLQIVRLIGPGNRGQGETVAQFAPQVGSNLFGFAVDGAEYLFGKSPLPGAPLLGTPILYPTPNRVRNARFSFGGRVFQFQANDGSNFLHGLVRDQAWQCDLPKVSESDVSVKTWISFAPGSRIYELFPIRNTLELVYTLEPGAIRYDFTVRNEDEAQLLPFGLAIHPYFNTLGSRESVRLVAPAEKWMEAEKLLPTGRLIDLEKGPADLRQPTPLSQLDLDDVFWGMSADKPVVIYYDYLGVKLTLTASAFFTHAVVYTPPSRPFFCVENQSCSTDAHNLHGQGLLKEAHLAVLKPGESLAASVQLSVGAQ